MKFKKPSSKGAKDTAVLVGGAVVGGMVSRGVFGQFHQPKGITAEDVKKDNTMSMVKRAVLIVGSAFGYAAVEGNDSTTSAIKGVLAGVAIAQTLDLVQDVAQKNPKTQQLAQSGKAANKFAARALGLACPCDQGLGRPRRRNRALRGTEMIPTVSSVEINAAQPMTELEAKFLAARNAAA